MKKKHSSKNTINGKNSIIGNKMVSMYSIAFLVCMVVFTLYKSRNTADVNMVGGGINKGASNLTLDNAAKEGIVKTTESTGAINKSRITTVDGDIVTVDNSARPFEGMEAGGGKIEEESTVSKVINYIEQKSGIDLVINDKATKGQPAETSKDRDIANCDDSSKCDLSIKEQQLRSLTVGAGLKGEDENGNKVEEETTDSLNSLGGRTITKLSTKSNPVSGSITQTREIVINDSNGKEVDKTITTYVREKNLDGTYKDQTTFTRNGKPVISTGKEPPSRLTQTSGNNLSTSSKSPSIRSDYNPENKCKAGNITVAEGTWVATGENMGGDGSQRKCVQIVSGCMHAGSIACNELYNQNPAQVVLPTNAGSEYTLGLPPSKVDSKNVPKVAANCITNGETVPSGNLREDVGVCDNGIWVDKSKYDAAQLALFEHNQTHLVETSFGKASSGSLDNSAQGSPIASDGFTRREQINQEKTYNSINDKIWTGISISLGGKELTIGSKINGNGWILPAASNSKLNHDNLYSGINISWLGGDLVFGKQDKDSKVYFDVDRPTFPSNYNEGFQGGAISCGLNPLIMAGCGVVMGVVGGINNLFTPDKPQSLGTPSLNTSTQINDTGPSQINNVTTPKTAGSTGGFNLSPNVSYKDQRDLHIQSQKGVHTELPNARGKTDAEQGCGVYTSFNMLKAAGYDVDLNLLKNTYIYNCTKKNVGCTASADATLLQIDNYVKGTEKFAQTNRITNAEDLNNRSGYYIYGGTVNGNIPHVAGFIVDNGQITSVDSLYGSSSCYAASMTELKCGNNLYHVGTTSGVPDSFYPLPIQ